MCPARSDRGCTLVRGHGLLARVLSSLHRVAYPTEAMSLALASAEPVGSGVERIDREQAAVRPDRPRFIGIALVGPSDPGLYAGSGGVEERPIRPSLIQTRPARRIRPRVLISSITSRPGGTRATVVALPGEVLPTEDTLSALSETGRCSVSWLRP